MLFLVGFSPCNFPLPFKPSTTEIAVLLQCLLRLFALPSLRRRDRFIWLIPVPSIFFLSMVIMFDTFASFNKDTHGFVEVKTASDRGSKKLSG